MITRKPNPQNIHCGKHVLRLMDGDWNPLWMEKLGDVGEPTICRMCFLCSLASSPNHLMCECLPETCKSRCKSKCATTVCWVKCHAAQRWMVSLCIGVSVLVWSANTPAKATQCQNSLKDTCPSSSFTCMFRAFRIWGFCKHIRKSPLAAM